MPNDPQALRSAITLLTAKFQDLIGGSSGPTTHEIRTNVFDESEPMALLAAMLDIAAAALGAAALARGTTPMAELRALALRLEVKFG